MFSTGPTAANQWFDPWRSMQNTFIIHNLFMQSILCILIPPPDALHWNEAKLRLCLKFKVVPLPWAICPHRCHARCKSIGKWDISPLAPLSLRAAAATIAQPVLPENSKQCLWHKVMSTRLFLLIMFKTKKKKKKRCVLRGEPKLSDLNRS